MARGKAISIGPRGSCCRQYEGRPGFWFEKNVAPQHHLWPEAFPETFIRERCVDALGREAKAKHDALEYCHRRRNEIQRQIDGLKAGPQELSPDDVGSLAAALANRTAMALRDEAPLSTLPLETLTRLKQAMPIWNLYAKKDSHIDKSNTRRSVGRYTDLLLDLVSDKEGVDRETMDSVAEAFDEALKASGTLLKPTSRKAVEAIYAAKLATWAELAEEAKNQGQSKAPVPKGASKLVTIDSLCEKSLEVDWHSPATIPGVRTALNKLMAWAASSYGISMVASIQQEHMREYGTLLRKSQPKSARKELSYLSAIFQCGIDHTLLSGPNPCQAIPQMKRSARMRVAKSIEAHKTLTLEELQTIDELMISDKQFYLYLLQRFTGARQQEIAGLRHCDMREKGGYKCIVIEPHEHRGLGINGQGSGIKTPQSVRYVPLPKILHNLWEHLKGTSKEPIFAKQDNERNFGENYRSRYHDKTKRRGLPSGTHSLRETLIQTLTTNNIREYVVRCITGKAMPMADYVHEDLPKMADAVELYSHLMPLRIEIANLDRSQL